MENVLYSKQCKCCGAEFKTDRLRVKICDLCKVENKKLSYKKSNENYKKPKLKNFRPAADIELMPLLRIIDRYNEKNGTCYSYGKFMQLVYDKKINIKEVARDARLPKKSE